MHGDGIKIELEIPLSLNSVDCASNAQVLRIPVEGAFDADLGSCFLRKEMAELLGVECVVSEVWLLSAVDREKSADNLHFRIISSVVWYCASRMTSW
jgi:hypothetical protein